MGGCIALFGWQEWQQASQRIHGYFLAFIEDQQFPFNPKALAFNMPANGRSIANGRFNQQIVEPKAIGNPDHPASFSLCFPICARQPPWPSWVEQQN